LAPPYFRPIAILMQAIHACIAGIDRNTAPNAGQTITIMSPLARPLRIDLIAWTIKAVQRTAATSGGQIDLGFRRLPEPRNWSVDGGIA